MMFIAGCATTEPVATQQETPPVVEPVQAMEPAPEPEPVMEERQVEDASRAFEESQKKGM